MADTSNATPKHLWVVGILALLWNSVGALDYVMTQTKNKAYMSAGNFSQEQLDYFYSMPTWMIFAWATAIWASVLGSLLLLLKKKLSTPVFLVSLIGVVVSSIYSYGLSNGYEIMGGAGAAAFSAAIFLIAVALYLYARKMTSNGVLN